MQYDLDHLASLNNSLIMQNGLLKERIKEFQEAQNKISVDVKEQTDIIQKSNLKLNKEGHVNIGFVQNEFFKFSQRIDELDQKLGQQSNYQMNYQYQQNLNIQQNQSFKNNNNPQFSNIPGMDGSQIPVIKQKLETLQEVVKNNKTIIDMKLNDVLGS